MFNCCLFANNKPNKKFNLKRGPQSVHKFIWQETEIILVGEAHRSISQEQADNYIKIFNDYIKESKNTTLFLEKLQDKREASQRLGFINCMLRLDPRPNLTTIAIDKRCSNYDFYKFLAFLMEAEIGEEHLYIKANEPQFTIKNIKGLAFINSSFNKYKNNFSFTDLIQLFRQDIGVIENLIEKYAFENINIASYLTNCLTKVNEALNLALKLGEVYRLMQRARDLSLDEETVAFQSLIIKNNEEPIEVNRENVLSEAPNEFKTESSHFENSSLLNICIEMMAFRKDFTPVKEWGNVFLLYTTGFLDATLLCDLWEEIKITHEKNTDTLIVVTGDEHTKQLSRFLKKVATPIAASQADKSNMILPHVMEEILHSTPVQKSNNTCSLM